jgi:hypothetical protein
MRVAPSPTADFPLNSFVMRALTAIGVAALLAFPARARAAEGAASPAGDPPAASAETAAAKPPEGAGGTTAAPANPSPAVRGTAVKKFPKLTEPSLEHVYQLGIALLPGLGFRVIAPYQDGIDCGQQAKRVCTGMLPFFMDVQPSFGVARHWDALVDLRFGIGTDFTHGHEIAVAPGVRYWVDPELPAKFFATIQAVYDVTNQNNVKVRDSDFAVRNSNGFMFEIMRNFGLYLQFGETIGFARWLRFEVDGGVGIQARMP